MRQCAMKRCSEGVDNQDDDNFRWINNTRYYLCHQCKAALDDFCTMHLIDNYGEDDSEPIVSRGIQLTSPWTDNNSQVLRESRWQEENPPGSVVTSGGPGAIAFPESRTYEYHAEDESFIAEAEDEAVGFRVSNANGQEALRIEPNGSIVVTIGGRERARFTEDGNLRLASDLIIERS